MRKQMLNSDKVYITSQDGFGNWIYILLLINMLFSYGWSEGFRADYGNKTK